jgi:hypothetical protein
MKSKLACWFTTAVIALFTFGCATAHPTRLEYKIVRPPIIMSPEARKSAKEPLTMINRLDAEGWRLVAVDQGSFYFSRPIHDR